MAKIFQHEVKIYRKDAKKDFSDKVWLMNRCGEHLRTMVHLLNSHKGKGYEIIMAQELRHLAQASSDILTAMMKNQPVPSTRELERAIFSADNRLTDIRKEGLIRRFDLKRLLQILSFYNTLKYYALDILAAAEKKAGPS